MGTVAVTTFMLYLTEDCNLRCTYCFVKKEPRRMTRETAMKAVDFLMARTISGRENRLNINFFGGEPFLEIERMEEVIAYAKAPRANVQKSIAFSATTNGTVASARAERIIRSNRMGLLLSIDGDHEASQYRPFVSGRASFDTVARNLPKLVDWSPDVVARVTFHPRSLNLVAKVQRVLELGASSVALCPVLEDDWTGLEGPLEEAYQALADWFIAEARRGTILPLGVSHRLLHMLHATQGASGARPLRPCEAGHRMLGINVDGQVMPCHRFIYRPQDWLGSVETPHLDARREPFVHLSSRDILGCDGCVAEAICGGGCRAVVLTAGGPLNGTVPSYCMTMRAHTRALQRIYHTLTGEHNPAFRAFLDGSARPLPEGLAEVVLR